jgi:hypothetical protein
MPTATLTYDAKMDSKKRVTLRGAKFEYYNVAEMDDGSILLTPRVLVSPFEISEKTLKTMDKSMTSFKKGKVSKPIIKVAGQLKKIHLSQMGEIED